MFFSRGLGSSLGLAIAAAFLNASRSIAVAQDISIKLDAASVGGPSYPRDHLRAVQDRHHYNPGRQGGRTGAHREKRVYWP